MSPANLVYTTSGATNVTPHIRRQFARPLRPAERTPTTVTPDDLKDLLKQVIYWAAPDKDATVVVPDMSWWYYKHIVSEIGAKMVEALEVRDIPHERDETRAKGKK